MENKTARKDLNEVVISGKLTRDITYVKKNDKEYGFVELYTFVQKNQDTKSPENYRHFTVIVTGKNVDRIKKLNLVKGSALTVEGHVNSYSIPNEDGSYKNVFNIMAKDFFPCTFSANMNTVMLTGRLASRKVASDEEGKKESIMKMFDANGKQTSNIDEVASIYFNVAVDALGKKGEDGKYEGRTQFIPCVAYAKNGVAKHLYTNIKTGYAVLINGVVATNDVRKDGKFVKRNTRVCVNSIRILEKHKDENIKYRKENNLPIPMAKTPSAPVVEEDYTEACDF